jgi:CheY-like chemotaxis protein
MDDPVAIKLRDKHLLIVEDEYLVASDLAFWFEDLGAKVIGPAESVGRALELVAENGTRIDAGLLDINLHGVLVYPVADALAELGVPFVFATGYDASIVPDIYASIARFEKPISKVQLARRLSDSLATR